jgi:hypothetical protein
MLRRMPRLLRNTLLSVRDLIAHDVPLVAATTALAARAAERGETGLAMTTQTARDRLLLRTTPAVAAS